MNQEMSNNLRTTFILIILISIAVFLRIWNLGVPSFWVDEINTLYIGQSWAESGEFTFPSGHEYHRAMLFSVIAGTGFRLFGANEFTTRLPSALFGLISILLVYMLAKDIFNKKVGLWSVFFMTFSHFQIGWSRTARMYTLLQCISLVIIFLFHKAYQPDRSSLFAKQPYPDMAARFRVFIRKRWVFFVCLSCGLVLCRISAIYIHFISYLLIGGLLLYLVLLTSYKLLTRDGSDKFFNRHAISTTVFLTVGILLFFFSPAIHHLITYFSHYIPAWAEGDVTARNRLLLLEFLISPYRFPLSVLFVLGAMQIFTRFQSRGILIFSMWAWILFFFSFISTYRVPAYFFFVYPLFLILAAYGLVNLIESEQRHFKQTLNKKNQHHKLYYFLKYILHHFPFVS